jgi:branched-chain amino acid transport system substrate-binding protein
MIWRSSMLAAGFGLAVLWAAGAAPASAAGPTCKDGVIKVGAVSTITGVVDFSEVPKATKVVFDQLNAAGGLNGCKIDFTLADDKGDPQVATQAARDLVDNKEVAVLAGSASLLDCTVNAPFYQRRGILAVQGLGVDAACFSTPSVAPVNVGPYTLSTAMAYFGSEKLKIDKVCAFFSIIGGTQEAYKGAIANWEKLSGKKVHLIDLTLPVQGDLTPFVIKARDAGCQGVLTNSVEPTVVQWIKTADAQKITGINWLFLAPGYTLQVAKALTGTQQAVYVGTEWEPFTEQNSPGNKDWIAAMNAAKLPLTAFSQGGYEAAVLLIDVLKTIDGPVTRESVTNALHTMKPIKNPLSGSPYVFGEDKAHTPMQATKVVKLDASGAWHLETPDWVVLPQMK